MSYRMYLNNYQICGNNEYIPELLEELERQGAVIQEGSIVKDFTIKEVEPVLNIIREYCVEQADFSKGYTPKKRTVELYNEDPYRVCSMLIEDLYIFQYYNIIKYLIDNGFIREKTCMNKEIEVLKEITFSAY